MKIKRQHYVNAVRREDEAWQGYEIRWPRYTYTIAEQPGGYLSVRWRFRAVRWSEDLRRDGEGKLRRVPLKKRAAWPDGGVFVPNEVLKPPPKSLNVNWKEPRPSDVYDPVEQAKSILRDAQTTAHDNPKAILKFVNRWGCLGVGIPDDEGFPFDGVVLTGMYLKTITDWIQRYQVIQKKKQSKFELEELAFLLNGVMVGVEPQVRPTESRLEPVYRVSRLLDVLWLECWEEATSGKQLRRCPECQSSFIPGRSNQLFCNRRCANRPTVRKAKNNKREQRNMLKNDSGSGFKES